MKNMTKEIIHNLLKEIEELKSQKSIIESKISNLNKKLLPEHYEIEDEDVDLEHLGYYTNYYFISKVYKVIGENRQDIESAILDAWNNYSEIKFK